MPKIKHYEYENARKKEQELILIQRGDCEAVYKDPDTGEIWWLHYTNPHFKIPTRNLDLIEDPAEVPALIERVKKSLDIPNPWQVDPPKETDSTPPGE